MKRHSFVVMIVAILMAAIMVAEISTAALRLPGAPILQLVTIVFGIKGRSDVYRMADRLIASQMEYAKEQDQELWRQFKSNKLSMQQYNVRRIYVNMQRQRYQRLHNLLKSEAHQQFDQMFEQELLAYAAQRLARSGRFVKNADDIGNFLGDSVDQLNTSIDRLRQLKELFWPDEIRRAHESIKEAREVLDRLRLLGPTPRKLEEALKQLDEKLEKLHERTEPRTVDGMIADLEESRKMTEQFRKEVSGVVDKFKELKAEAIRVTRWTSKKPEIQDLVSEISAVDQMIVAPELRRAMGDEMQERLKDLGIKPDSPEFQQIREQYIQNLREHLGKNRDAWLEGGVRLTPAEMDRLLVQAVKQVTGEDVAFPEVVAIIKGEIFSGKAPLEVHLDGGESRGSLVDYEWRINGSSATGGPIFSHTFEKPGDYTISLRVLDRRGKSHTAYQKITVTPKYDVQVSVQVSVRPPKVAPGEDVTISAQVTVKGIENPQMTTIFKVDGKEFRKVEEEGGYDTPTSVVFPVPKDNARSGEWTVSVQSIAKLPDEIKKAFGKDSISSQEVSDSFHVTGEEEPGDDPFVGNWLATLRMIDHWDKKVLAENAGKDFGGDCQITITRSGDEYSILYLEPMQHVDSSRVEGSTLTVKGWSMREEEVVDDNGVVQILKKKDIETIKLLLSQDGNTLIGTTRADFDVESGSGKYRIFSVTARRADDEMGDSPQAQSRSLQPFMELEEEVEKYRKDREN